MRMPAVVLCALCLATAAVAPGAAQPAADGRPDVGQADGAAKPAEPGGTRPRPARPEGPEPIDEAAAEAVVGSSFTAPEAAPGDGAAAQPSAPNLDPNAARALEGIAGAQVSLPPGAR